MIKMIYRNQTWFHTLAWINKKGNAIRYDGSWSNHQDFYSLKPTQSRKPIPHNAKDII